MIITAAPNKVIEKIIIRREECVKKMMSKIRKWWSNRDINDQGGFSQASFHLRRG